MKKKIIIYVNIIMFIILCVSSLISYADNTDKIYVNLKSAKEDGTGYALTNVPPGKRIWELAQYTSSAGTTRVTTPKELYCIKASYGKTWETEQNTDGVVEYNRSYNFNDGESILNNFTSNSATTVLSELLKGDTYKEISWLLDNFYIPGDDDSSETQKTNYLVNAGIPVDDIDNLDNEYFWKFDLDERVVLSQDEIVAIQKAVIWYFTNGGTFYDFTSSDGSWLYKTIDGGASYKSQDALTSKERAECKQKEIQTLYNYLIDSAKQAAQNNYTSSSSSVTVDKGSVTKQSSNGNYIIGPIKLVGTATSSTTITMNVTNQSGTAITNYTIVDKSGNTISSTLKELVGKTEGFYIKVPKTGIQQVNIEIVVKSATATKKTLWVKGTDQNGKVALDGEQPLVEISREETTDKTNITVDTSEFDLALRKYITAVSKDETIDKSDYLLDSNNRSQRAPSIIATNLGKTDTTAIYNHRKDPVQVESGNYVQYAITIFNEGNIDGYASQIVDQLPEGLICYDSLNPQKIQSVGPDGKTRNTYTITNISPEGNSTTANRIIFDIDKENAKNLSAYGTTLDYETITFKCKVTKTPDVDNQKILTNVAWISADSNAKNLSDIDSQPSTIPNGTDGKTVNQGNIENYIGNTSNKTDLTDSNYYYKGYQDDDDFEKLVILPDSRVFDLALRKNIISVTTNGTTTELKNDSSRIPTVDTTKLDNKTSTTADYKHKKDPVVVKEGSTVKYRITIYNEGDIAGRATKIVDQLPTGLKFLRVTSGNFVESTDATEVAELNNNNKLTLVRKSDNTTNLKAYETGKTIDSEIIEIECEVTAVADENNDKILTNIAWIASEVDEKGNSKDRDSEAKTPDTIYDKDQLVTSDNGYTGKNTETDLTNKDHYYEGQEDDDDFEKIVIKPINGNYNVVLVKEDASGEQLDSKATFEVNGVEKEVIGKLTIAENVKITRENLETADVYTIKETKAPDGYCEFNGTITITVNKKQEDNKYSVDNILYKVVNSEGKEITSNSIDNIYLSDDGNIYVKIKNYQFDLALRKNIISVTTNGTTTELKNDSSRIPTVDTTKLDNKTSTTADYKHKKDPVVVKEGSTVKYRITIYNEGDIAGRATKIVDQLPTGLKFLRVTSGNFVESTDATEVAELNNNNKLTLVRKSDNTTNLKAYETGKTIDSEIIEIECEVTAVADENNDKILTNIAWIASEVDEKGNSKDRDSEAKTPDTIYDKDQLVTSDNGYTGKNTETDLTNKDHYYEGQEDDDDFEKIVIKPINGNYNVVLVKEDASGEQLDSKATFEVNGEIKEVVGKLTIAEKVKITRENVETADIYTIKETKAPDGYCEFNGIITVTVNKKQEDNKYIVDNISYKVTNENGEEIKTNVIDKIYLDDDGNIYVKIKNYQFDLALRKNIISVTTNGTTTELKNDSSRIPTVDTTKIDNKTSTTADYKHKKDPVVVKEGSTVKYRITIYNEGDIAGRATKIVDQLPTGLKFLRVTSGNFVESTDATEVAELNNNNKLTLVRKSDNTTNLKAYETGKTIDSEIIEIECEVTAVADENNDKILTNIAWIASEVDEKGNSKDRDSEAKTPDTIYDKDQLVTSDNGYTGKNTETDLTNKDHYYEGQEDDDDFEKIVIKPITGSYNITLIKEDASGEQLDSKATFEVNGVEKEVIGKLTIAENVRITREKLETADIYTIKETKAPDGYCEFIGTITITVNKKIGDDKYIVDSVTYKVTDKDGKDITSTSKEIDNIYLSDDGNIYVKIKNYQFDLKLIKRIVEVNGEKVPERIQKVDVSKLNTRDENGKLITTGDYTLDKTPVAVKKGDIVKYTFRIYNEGNIDGYAAEITEDIPDGLEFIWNEKSGDELKADTTLTEAEKEAIAFNQSQLWAFKKTDINATTGKIEMITTDYLSKDREAVDENLIKAFDSKKGYIDTDKEKNPDYKEVSVMLKVVSDDVSGKVIRNEACISKDTDKNGNEVDDRDSKPEEWPGREPDHKYEDDEDYDNVILSTFDLALRKFIVATGKNEKIEKKDYLTNSNGTYQREPVVDTSKLNTVGEDGKLITTAIYNHTKEPILVQKGDYVVYCLRVYNEGSTDGYAAEVKDYLPEYLEFVNGEFNDKYGWKVSEDGRVVTTSYLSSDKYLIKAAQTVDGKIKLNYQDIMILCKVKDTAITGEKVTNIAEISKYEDKKHEKVDDRDSGEGNVKVPTDKDLPSYKDNESGNYIPGQEDDDDFEKIIIKKFDLALRKFITKVQENDVTTRIPQVKYKDGKISYEHTKDPVTLHVNDVVIYTIRVYNEGEIDGYASEISDDIPEYLEYLPEDSTNKEYKWVMYDKDGKETDKVEKATKLKTTYLSKENEKKDGEYLLKAFDGNVENISYHDVKIAFKVKDPNSNTYIITNHAQISDDTDKNGKEIDDIDSKTDEWIEGEDDQDVEHVKVEYFDLSLLKYVTKVIVEENGKQQITETGYNGLEDPEPVVKVELKRKKLNEVVVKFGYGIKITNEGDIAGYAKEITDYIPEGLKFVAEDNPDWKDEGNNVISTRKLENTLLQPGESATVEVILTWINGADNLAEKTNTAEISEDHNEYDVPDRDSTPDNQVPGEDDIDIAKVILLISTGTVQTYFALTLGLLAIVFVGVFLIKKFVL